MTLTKIIYTWDSKYKRLDKQYVPFFLAKLIFCVAIIHTIYQSKVTENRELKILLLNYQKDTGNTYIGLAEFNKNISLELHHVGVELVVREYRDSPNDFKNIVLSFLEKSEFDYKKLSISQKLSLYKYIKSIKDDYFYFKGKFLFKDIDVKKNIESITSDKNQFWCTLDSSKAIDGRLDGTIKNILKKEPNFTLVFKCNLNSNNKENLEMIKNLSLFLPKNNSEKIVLSQINISMKQQNALLRILALEKSKKNESQNYSNKEKKKRSISRWIGRGKEYCLFSKLSIFVNLAIIVVLVVSIIFYKINDYNIKKMVFVKDIYMLNKYL